MQRFSWPTLRAFLVVLTAQGVGSLFLGGSVAHSDHIRQADLSWFGGSLTGPEETLRGAGASPVAGESNRIDVRERAGFIPSIGGTFGPQIYRTYFNDLLLGDLVDHPGLPGQGGWYKDLVIGNATAGIQDSIAAEGRAIALFAPIENPTGVQTIARRRVGPRILGPTGSIFLSFRFLCRTSNLEARNNYFASVEVRGGPHPGFEIIGAALQGGNSGRKDVTGVNLHLGEFLTEFGGNSSFLPPSGQGLAWDTWHTVTVGIDLELDEYSWITINGIPNSLQGRKPPRSCVESVCSRGTRIEEVLAQVIPTDGVEPPEQTDDFFYVDDVEISLTAQVPTDVNSAIAPALPEKLLVSARPNPGSGRFQLQIAAPRFERVEARLYDVTGRRVRDLVDRKLEAGVHSLTWDGKDEAGQSVVSGVYFLRVAQGKDGVSKKITVLR